jgi:hypothetical protein
VTDPEAHDRVLNSNEAAISDVRRKVAEAVGDINRALNVLQQVLDEQPTDLFAPPTEDDT